MLWCLIFMISGVLIFASGVAFERGFFENEEALGKEENEDGGVSPVVLKQWENLLGYDGNEQEEYDENN